MSLIKGFDRIFLIISIVAIFPAGVLSLYFGKGMLTVETTEYSQYLKKIETEIKNELALLSDDEVKFQAKKYVDNNKKMDSVDRSIDQLFLDEHPRFLFRRYKFNELISMAPAQYKYPSTFVLVSVTILSALAQGVALFFILKSFTRLIKWVVDGFKEQK